MIAWTLTGLLPLLIPLLLISVLLCLLFLLVGRLLPLVLLCSLVPLPIIGLLSRLGALVAPRAGLPLLLTPIALPVVPWLLLAGLFGLPILTVLLAGLCVRLGGLPGSVCLPLIAVLTGLLVLFALLPRPSIRLTIPSRLRILVALLPGLRVPRAILSRLRIRVALLLELWLLVARATLFIGRKRFLPRLARVSLRFGSQLRLAAGRILLAGLPGLRIRVALLSGCRVSLAGLPGSLILGAPPSGLRILPAARPRLLTPVALLPGLRVRLAGLSGLIHWPLIALLPGQRNALATLFGLLSLSTLPSDLGVALTILSRLLTLVAWLPGLRVRLAGLSRL